MRSGGTASAVRLIFRLIIELGLIFCLIIKLKGKMKIRNLNRVLPCPDAPNGRNLAEHIFYVNRLGRNGL